LLDIDKRKNFDIIYLKEFNDEQIKAFLQKRVPLIEAQKEKKQGWRYYYQKIHDVFDLKDLAKRPVLLELITKYLPQLIEKGEKINASTLYLTTIQEELKRRLTVGKTVIQRDDRIKLMKMLAVWMYNHDKLSVYYEDISELLNLKAQFNLKARTDIEYHLNDFLTCSFLNRDTSGNYQFSHKSFVDFLTAWKFVEDIEKDFIDDFAQMTITKEVMQFMSDFVIIRDKLYQWIEWTKKKSFSVNRYMGGNAVSVLNELGEDFAKNGFDFSETVVDYADFHNQDLTGLNFKKTSLKNANMNNTILKDTDFSFADLEGASFLENDDVPFLSFDSKGKFLAVLCRPELIVKILEVKTWEEIATLGGHENRASNVAFSPDGAFLASGGYDRTIKIWNVKTWEEIATLRGHVDIVYGVAFSSDGAFLASGSRDKTIKIWNVKTWEEIATLRGHDSEVYGVAFSPDGGYLASGSADKTIKIWDAHPKSSDFGRCLHTVKQQIHCEGMNIKRVKGLDKEKMKFLAERGAIGVSKDIMEEIREM
jgi:WD40 repeat protein